MLLLVPFLYPMARPPSTLSSIVGCDFRDDLPFSVVQYMEDFCDSLGATRLASMHFSDDAQTVFDEWNGRGVIPLWVLGTNVGDIGVVIVHQNWALISSVLTCRTFVVMKKWGTSHTLATWWLTHAASVSMNGPSSWTLSSLYRVRMICFSPFQIRRFRRATWTSSFGMLSSGRCLFLGWRSVEAFVLPPWQRGDFYATPSEWWPPYTWSCLLSVPSLPVFSYYSSPFFEHRLGASNLWHLEITEY